MWPWLQQGGYGGGGWGAPQMYGGWGGGFGMPQLQGFPQSYGGYGQYNAAAQLQPQYGSYNPGPQAQQAALAPQADRTGNQQQRLANMQEQYKAAGSDQQRGIQRRMTGLENRMGRQAARAAAPAPGLQAPTAAGAPAPGQYGTYTDQFGNATTKEAYDARLGDWNQNLTLMSPSLLNTSFGTLTQASGGNNNLFKREGGGENELFNYDPTKGWNQMSLGQYHANPNAQYQNPFASEAMARQAGAQVQKFRRF